MRSTGVRLVTRPTEGTVPTPRLYRRGVHALPPWTAVVLAGGRAARLGGRPKPQLEVGGRTMLDAVLAATAAAAARIVVGPPQRVPEGVLLLREQPPGGGPVAALRAGLARVETDVVAVLAADLPFLTAEVVEQLLGRLERDGVLVVDESNRDRLLLGVWRTAALRRVLAGPAGPTSMRRLIAPLAVDRLQPALAEGQLPPWTDCDTPADLARARAAVASVEPAPPPAIPAPVAAPRRPPTTVVFQEPVLRDDPGPPRT
jgi:molybdopterin-guanine dinucleotide biosynthesis protein A